MPPGQIDDLYEDIRSGVQLCFLVEVLTGERLVEILDLAPFFKILLVFFRILAKRCLILANQSRQQHKTGPSHRQSNDHFGISETPRRKSTC